MSTQYRTSTFLLSGEDFGTAYLYRAGKEFQRQWDMLLCRWPKSIYNLPTSSLETALRLLTGTFVKVRPRFHYSSSKSSSERPFLVAREPISESILARALQAWEQAIFEDDALGRLPDLAGDLKETEEWISRFVHPQDRACPSADGWVWEVAHWKAASELASRPLHHDIGALDLRLDSEAKLVGWDQPIKAGDPPRKALVYLDLQVLTIPGWNRLALQIRPKVSRLAHQWWNVGRVRKAWVQYRDDRPLSFVDVQQGREGPTWDDRLPAVLRRADLKQFPHPEEEDPQVADPVAARLESPPQNFPIGKGPGQPLHDAVSMWARDALSDPKPIEYVKAARSLRRTESADTRPSSTDLSRAGKSRPFRIVCFYESPAVRSRMLEGLTGPSEQVPPLPEQALTSSPPDNLDDPVEVAPGIEVVLRTPPETGVLTSSTSSREVERATGALEEDFSWMDRTEGTLAVLAETPTEEVYSQLAPQQDPKFHLRALLGQRGAVTQFLSVGSSSGYELTQSAWDLLSKAGLFPHRFPQKYISSENAPLFYVGAACKKKYSWDGANGKNGNHVLSLVAVEAGGNKALGYHPQEKEWVPLGEAVGSFHGLRREVFSKEKGVRHALEAALLEIPGSSVLYFEAQDLRRIWKGLQDTTPSGEDLPTMPEKSAMVRVRTENALEVPQIAGKGPWPSGGDGVATGRFTSVNALLTPKSEGSGEPLLYAASSSQFNRPIGHDRWVSRFSVDDQSASLPSVVSTEFLCMESGPFAKQNLYQESAVLCRHATSWRGTLRKPVPLHLAQSIIDDHPLKMNN